MIDVPEECLNCEKEIPLQEPSDMLDQDAISIHYGIYPGVMNNIGFCSTTCLFISVKACDTVEELQYLLSYGV